MRPHLAPTRAGPWNATAKISTTNATLSSRVWPALETGIRHRFRSGRMTREVLDALGRTRQVILADGTVTETGYDAADQRAGGTRRFSTRVSS